MSPIGLAILVLAVVAVVVAILYNRLVRTRLHVREAWAAIDVQLQRRASLIPNLVETVKGYAAYERGTLKEVVEARSAVSAARWRRYSSMSPNGLFDFSTSSARCA